MFDDFLYDADLAAKMEVIRDMRAGITIESLLKK